MSCCSVGHVSPNLRPDVTVMPIKTHGIHRCVDRKLLLSIPVWCSLFHVLLCRLAHRLSMMGFSHTRRRGRDCLFLSGATRSFSASRARADPRGLQQAPPLKPGPPPPGSRLPLKRTLRLAIPKVLCGQSRPRWGDSLAGCFIHFAARSTRRRQLAARNARGNHRSRPGRLHVAARPPQHTQLTSPKATRDYS